MGHTVCNSHRSSGWHTPVKRGAANRLLVRLSLLGFILAWRGGAWADNSDAGAHLGPPPEMSAVPLIASESSSYSATQGVSVDIQDRADVVNFWNTEYKASNGVAMGWTGSIATCNAGTTTADYQQATLRRVNYFRAMAQLPAGLTLDPTLNPKCQELALMVIANGDLSHDPPNTWTCWTQDGHDAAMNSNIALGAAGPTAVDLYIRDPGAGNYPVGHRRWLLFPPLEQIGAGSTSGSYHDEDSGYTFTDSNAIWVIGLSGTRPAGPEWVSWPPPGYVPYSVVYERWSFSYHMADFTNATVTMSRGGTPISLVLETVDNRNFGDRTLVWRPEPPLPAKPSNDTTYSVTISNVLINSVAREFTYSVTIIDPDGVPPTPSPTTTPAPTLTPTPAPLGQGIIVH